jgi:hypothetical protein
VSGESHDLSEAQRATGHTCYISENGNEGVKGKRETGTLFRNYKMTISVFPKKIEKIKKIT